MADKAKFPKRIIVEVTEDDHETIKKLAASYRMTIRSLVLIALASIIKASKEEIVSPDSQGDV